MYWIRSIQANFIVVSMKINIGQKKIKKNKRKQKAKSMIENTREFIVYFDKIQRIACVQPIKERCTRKKMSQTLPRRGKKPYELLPRHSIFPTFI